MADTTLAWILVIALGALLAVSLINPDAFSTITDKNNSIISSTVRSTPNYMKITPSEMDKYKGGVSSCVKIEAAGEQMGISDPKEKVCRELCGNENMTYYSLDCNKNILSCYCRK